MKAITIICLSLIFCFANTIKADTITKSKVDSTVVTKDTAKSVTDITTLNVSKPVTKSPIAWITYVTVLLATVLLKVLPNVSAFANLLNKSNNVLIKRYISETSEFMHRIGVSALLIGGIIACAAPYTTGDTLTILKAVGVMCASIGGFTLITTKNPELTK